MMTIARRVREAGRELSGWLGLVVLPMFLVSCAQEIGAPAPEAAYQPVEGQAEEARSGAPSNGAALARKSDAGYSAPQTARPGLGTGWGSAMSSPMTHTTFVRASSKPHRGISTIWYNDKEGIEAMTRGAATSSSGRQRSANGLVEWGVKSGFGYLKSYQWDGKRFVAGKAGSRYAIVIKSHARSRLELVLSVDGLDVLDGESASTKKRGYILWPGQTLEVKGWRTSMDQVASFEFASVTGSYSNLKGSGTRNVGVIGLAVFTEKGIDPWNGFSLEAGSVAAPFAEAPMHRAR